MNTISVGIDISKDKFDAAFVRDDHTSVLRTFNNTPSGINRFVGELTQQRTAYTVPCVIESTGIYHLPVALMVSNAGYRVNCINPLITKKYQRSSVRNAKTDSIDALRLASIGIQEPDMPLFEANIEAIEARRVVTYIGKLEALKQQLQASLKAMKAMEAVTGLKVDLGDTVSAIRLLTRQIVALTKEVVSRTSGEILKSSEEICGLSKERQALLFALIGDKKFASRDALVAFVGLDVMPRQSGKWQGHGKLSKRGNGYARKILFQIAWGLKQYDPTYKKRYVELRAAGKPYKTVLIILARKFLRFTYGRYFKVDRSL